MRALLLIATLLACGNSFAEAQRRPNDRKGFWAGFGLGRGSAGLDCDGCSDDRFSGNSGYIRLGGTVSRNLLVGFESNAWLNSADGVDETIGFGSVVLLWYPSARSGLYLKVGLGGMVFSSDDGTQELSATAPSASIGLGYEFRLTRNMSLVPYVNSLASSSVEVRIDGQSIGTYDLSINLFQFGLGITWH